MVEPTRSPPVLWLDATPSLWWDRPAVGIVRVEQQLAREALRQPPGSCRFCRYDKSAQNFVEVSPQVIASRLAGEKLLRVVDNTTVPPTKEFGQTQTTRATA